MTYDITIKAKALLAIAGFQSKEQARYYLCGVHMEWVPETAGIEKRARIVATDGSILGLMDDAIIDYENESNTTVFQVTPDLIRLLKHKDADQVTYEADGVAKVYSVKTKTNTDGEQEFVSKKLIGACLSGIIDGATFPDYTRVVPAISDEMQSANICFDPAKLIPFHTAAKLLTDGSKFCPIKLNMSDEKSPILVRIDESGRTRFKGVLMPYKMF